MEQLMERPRVAMERDDHLVVASENGLEVGLAQPMRMDVGRRDSHQIDDVDEAQPQLRDPFTQQRRRRQRFKRRHVPVEPE